MKTLLVAVNAKYIHTNLAIRLLKKNTTKDVDIIDFTIKDDIVKITDYILKNNYEFVGFSCYIWNIEVIKEIALNLRKHNLKIMFGGPEVSYNHSEYLNIYCDYVIKDEGEEAFDKLLRALNNEIPLTDVPNLYYENKYTFSKMVDLNNLKLAYDLCDDVANKIIYIETSRGCPYKCSYCMASLDNKVRFFNIEEIKKQLLILINRGAKVFKFLDRTFNANKKNFINLIDFVKENHHNCSFQFEITGDLLDSDVIDYINDNLTKNIIRFEIGIQSTNIEANKAVYRIQNNEKLFNNIKKIQDGGVIDLHLDLIAGLPFEDLNSFKKTFNEVLSLYPKELQLGFLKILHGTKLEEETNKYGYIYSKKAPYEIISNNFLSSEDILLIHHVEDLFDIYYNKPHFTNSIRYILKNVENQFDFFLDFYLSMDKKTNKTLQERFISLINYIKTKPYFKEALILIYKDYLSFFKLKPQPIWPKLDITIRKKLVLEVLQLSDFDFDTLSRYSIIIKVDTTYIVAIYKPNNILVTSF